MGLGQGATNPQFQIHLENKALTLAGLMSPRVSERGSVPSLSRLLQDFRIRCLIGRPAQRTLRLSSGSSGRGYSATSFMLRSMTDDEVRFGQFHFHLGRRQLFRDESPLRLGGRALDVLHTLVAAKGDVVSKEVAAIGPSVSKTPSRV